MNIPGLHTTPTPCPKCVSERTIEGMPTPGVVHMWPTDGGLMVDVTCPVCNGTGEGTPTLTWECPTCHGEPIPCKDFAWCKQETPCPDPNHHLHGRTLHLAEREPCMRDYATGLLDDRTDSPVRVVAEWTPGSET